MSMRLVLRHIGSEYDRNKRKLIVNYLVEKKEDDQNATPGNDQRRQEMASEE